MIAFVLMPASLVKTRLKVNRLHSKNVLHIIKHYCHLYRKQRSKYEKKCYSQERAIEIIELDGNPVFQLTVMPVLA